MSSLALRSVAIFLMLLDHIGYATGNAALRVVGRISLPIFAFLIANGFRHTHSVPKYALRLLIFALISEIPYDLYFNGGKITLLAWGRTLPHPRLDNVFFTLFLGLCFLWLRDIYKKRVPRFAPLCSAVTLLILSFGNAYISADYGVLGVFWVGLFGVFDVQIPKHRIPLCIGALLLASWRLLSITLLAVLGLSTQGIPVASAFFPCGVPGFMDRIQPFAALSMFLILAYNGHSGMPKSPILRRILQYAFYVFYPLHILIILWVF